MMALAILRRDGERISGVVTGIEIWQARLMHGQADRDHPAAGTDISDNRSMSRVEFTAADLQGGFNQQFGLRARNQDALVNVEIEAIKFFMTGEVGDRGTLGAALDG